MASMQQIIVKITGQDSLTPVLAKIAKSMDNVNKSGKQLSKSFTSSLNQMEKNASKTATQINKSLNQANKIQFKTLGGGFNVTAQQMETQAQNASKIINSAMETINKTKFQTLGTELTNTTKGMETLSKISATDIGNAMAHVNNTQFIGLSANFQTAIKGMGSASKIASTGIARDFDQVNRTRFTGIVSSFKSAMSSMGSAAKSTAQGIGSAFDGMGGMLAGAVGVGSFMELFDKARGRAVTGTILKNRFGEQQAGELQNTYYGHTQESATSDEYLDIIAKGSFQMKTLDPNSFKGILSLSDAFVSGETGSYQQRTMAMGLGDFLKSGDTRLLKEDFAKGERDKLEAAYKKARRSCKRSGGTCKKSWCGR